MTRKSTSAVLALLFALGVAGTTPAESGRLAPSLAPKELAARRAQPGAPLVIDVRSAAEFEAGHIPGALNIPYAEIAERIEGVEAPNGVALYCMVGPRARKGEAALLQAGRADVFHIEGGLKAWKAAGLPVATGPASRAASPPTSP